MYNILDSKKMTTVIKTNSKTTNKLEKIKIFINIYSVLTGISITETEVIVLSSFICDGVTKNTKDELLKAKVVKNMNVLDNVISKIRSKGLLTKENYRENVCKELMLNFDNQLLIELKIS